jgi:mannose-6-phosphate isomerase-like protein (cupin superfamily)
MTDPKHYIESGILELYVLGQTTTEEAREIELLAQQHIEIREELMAIEKGLEAYAHTHAVQPHETIGPLLFATIRYMDRLGSGELPTEPPLLHKNSTKEDYASWLNREDLNQTDDYENLFLHLIGHNAQATTAIVWIKTLAPDEVHHDEHERFFILEGTCEITVGNTVHALKAGDYFEIPLHADHFVTVTSQQPCKVILQRVAA